MRHTRLWVVWMPALLVASLLYWTVALGLGGLSLMAVSGLSGNDDGLMLPSPARGEALPDTATEPPDRYDPIVVHLEESAEPEDVDDNVGCAFSFEAEGGQDGPGDGHGQGDGERDPRSNGPGNTAF